jgi:hypothetical protein
VSEADHHWLAQVVVSQSKFGAAHVVSILTFPPCCKGYPKRALVHEKSVVASEHDRPDIARRRAQWKKYQSRIEPERLVFIDETWTKTNMAPLRGWSSCGMRLIDKVPYGHWKTTTFLAAASPSH